MTSQSVSVEKLYPFLHRLGSVAMLCVSVVLHLSRPVEVGGDRGWNTLVALRNFSFSDPWNFLISKFFWKKCHVILCVTRLWLFCIWFLVCMYWICCWQYVFTDILEWIIFFLKVISFSIKLRWMPVYSFFINLLGRNGSWLSKNLDESLNLFSISLLRKFKLHEGFSGFLL